MNSLAGNSNGAHSSAGNNNAGESEVYDAVKGIQQHLLRLRDSVTMLSRLVDAINEARDQEVTHMSTLVSALSHELQRHAGGNGGLGEPRVVRALAQARESLAQRDRSGEDRARHQIVESFDAAERGLRARIELLVTEMVRARADRDQSVAEMHSLRAAAIVERRELQRRGVADQMEQLATAQEELQECTTRMRKAETRARSMEDALNNEKEEHGRMERRALRLADDAAEAKQEVDNLRDKLRAANARIAEMEELVIGAAKLIPSNANSNYYYPSLLSSDRRSPSPTLAAAARAVAFATGAAPSSQPSSQPSSPRSRNVNQSSEVIRGWVPPPATAGNTMLTQHYMDLANRGSNRGSLNGARVISSSQPLVYHHTNDIFGQPVPLVSSSGGGTTYYTNSNGMIVSAPTSPVLTIPARVVSASEPVVTTSHFTSSSSTSPGLVGRLVSVNNSSSNNNVGVVSSSSSNEVDRGFLSYPIQTLTGGVLGSSRPVYTTPSNNNNNNIVQPISSSSATGPQPSLAEEWVRMMR